MEYLTDMYIEESNEKIIPNILRISHLNLLGVALKLRCKPPIKTNLYCPTRYTATKSFILYF
jgi:hypothetical protein